jgi:hypothetical protein
MKSDDLIANLCQHIIDQRQANYLRDADLRRRLEKQSDLATSYKEIADKRLEEIAQLRLELERLQKLPFYGVAT